VHVVATAGHVDHGKSTLVRALTGMEPDRWAEERRRGMTIDLGFAWTDLPSGQRLAFVDVPGHARFVPNMLAGVGPVPAVLFVVAADEGWRQQSAEHLAAVDALDVRHGLLAVTRSDLADPVPAVVAARGQLAATSLGAVEAVSVSGRTGAGLARLRAALDRLVAALPSPDPGADVRLWVDRAFTIRGSGTVVTGTLGAGTLHVGDSLVVLPGNRPVQVRALQVTGSQVESVGPVARVAVNLRGTALEDVRRGCALVAPVTWSTSDEVDVRVSGTPTAELPAELVLHLGSAARGVRIRPLGPDTARLRLPGPLPLRPGDRGLVRDPGRARVAGGVLVLDVAPPPLRRRGAAGARGVELARMGGGADPVAEVLRRGLVRRTDLAAAGLLPLDEPAPAGLVAAGDWLADPQRWTALGAALAAAVTEHAAAYPLAAGLPAEAARRSLGLPDRRLLGALVAGTEGMVAEGGRIRAAGARPIFPPGVAAGLDRLRERLAAAPYAAAEADELVALGLTAPVLAAAARAGLLLRISDAVYLLPGAEEEAVRRLAGLVAPFTLSEARQALGTTRRVAVPLLEALDAAGRTRRVDGARRELRTARPGVR
jgi:selenocysteine-specific elongation factor